MRLGLVVASISYSSVSNRPNKVIREASSVVGMELDSQRGVREVDVVQDKDDAGRYLPPTTWRVGQWQEHAQWETEEPSLPVVSYCSYCLRAMWPHNFLKRILILTFTSFVFIIDRIRNIVLGSNFSSWAKSAGSDACMYTQHLLHGLGADWDFRWSSQTGHSLQKPGSVQHRKFESYSHL